MTKQRDIIAEMAKVYRIEVAGEPGRYYGIIIHKPSGHRLEMRTLYATESAANLATGAFLTGAVKRRELPLL
jgi:hypothetical protein